MAQQTNTQKVPLKDFFSNRNHVLTAILILALIIALSLLVGFNSRLVTFLAGTTSLAPGAGATLSLSPASPTVQYGDTLSMEVRLNTGQGSAIASAVRIDFDETRLQVDSVTGPTAANSFDYIVQTTPGEQFNNTTGKITLDVGEPGQGLVGSNILVATINFSAKDNVVGAAAVNFEYGGSRDSGPSYVTMVDDPSVPSPVIYDILDNVQNGTVNITAPTPSVQQVTPNTLITGYAGTPSVSIVGSDFGTNPTVQFVGAQTYSISNKTVSGDGTTITGNLPNGMALGSYTVRVTNLGATGQFVDGFSVRQLVVPDAPTVTGDPFNVRYSTKLKASWPAVAGNIVRYEYQILENGTATPVRDWTNIQLNLTYEARNLSLQNGKQYTMRVRAIGSDNGQEVAGNIGSTQLISTKTANLDGDTNEVVGFDDFLQLLAVWGLTGTRQQDINNDGIVGFTDFTELLARWNE